MTARGTTRLAAILTAPLLAVSACGSDADSDQREEAAASESSTTSETVEAAATATPEQLASVIAGVESDWREVVDQAGDCRFSWVMAQDDPAEKANRMTCYMREVTAGYTSQTTIESLAELNVPDSMTSLVDETNAALQSVVDVELEAVCGEATEGPKDTKACDRALGERMGAYNSLERVLDKWGPYL